MFYKKYYVFKKYLFETKEIFHLFIFNILFKNMKC